MSQALNFLQGNPFLTNISAQKHGLSLTILPHKSCFPNRKGGVRFLLQVNSKLVNHVEQSLPHSKAKPFNEDELHSFPHVQTLSKFPTDKLFRKVIMVRFDSTILFIRNDGHHSPPASASTIKFLHNAGAKVILLGSWSQDINSNFSSVAESLSLILKLKVVPMKLASPRAHHQLENSEKFDVLLLENLSDFKTEVANSSKFAKELASGVDIFVNDAFSQSHKLLASTVGITRFCSVCIAGFHFEEGLYQLKKIITTTKRPYVAMIGGSNLAAKEAALRFLASKCDALVFVGNMAFQILHAMGVQVPMKFVERRALSEAISIIEYANSRNVPIVLPKDFYCENIAFPKKLEIFPIHSMLNGWQPIELGPLSLQEIVPLLSKSKVLIEFLEDRRTKYLSSTPYQCKLAQVDMLQFRPCYKLKQLTWHVQIVPHQQLAPDGERESKLAEILSLSESTCEVTVVGKTAYEELLAKSTSVSVNSFVENASIFWEFLKGRKLPGLMALDRDYPFDIDWDVAYADPFRPLVVDIGSGNGLFLFGMAKRQKDMNFLGLEINSKLVNRCQDHVHRSGIKNAYFIPTNATSTFRSIVSSCPGDLVLVSIQCPNPDFNKPEHRWRMLQRSLVEAITDLLTFGGNVFLQSDIEAVALRMKKEFLEYGKGKLVLVNDQETDLVHRSGWLRENPFGVRSDWEQHVLDRGEPMYRLLLSKVET